MADMTEAQASQALKKFLAGVQWAQNLSQALDLALEADRRLLSAQNNAGRMEDSLKDIQARIDALTADRLEAESKVKDAMNALALQQAAMKQEQAHTAAVISERQDAIARDTREAQSALLALEGQIKDRKQELENAKTELAAFHAKVAGLAQ